MTHAISQADLEANEALSLVEDLLPGIAWVRDKNEAPIAFLDENGIATIEFTPLSSGEWYDTLVSRLGNVPFQHQVLEKFQVTGFSPPIKLSIDTKTEDFQRLATDYHWAKECAKRWHRIETQKNPGVDVPPRRIIFEDGAVALDVTEQTYNAEKRTLNVSEAVASGRISAIIEALDRIIAKTDAPEREAEQEALARAMQKAEQDEQVQKANQKAWIRLVNHVGGSVLRSPAKGFYPTAIVKGDTGIKPEWLEAALNALLRRTELDHAFQVTLEPISRSDRSDAYVLTLNPKQEAGNSGDCYSNRSQTEIASALSTMQEELRNFPGTSVSRVSEHATPDHRSNRPKL